MLVWIIERVHTIWNIYLRKRHEKFYCMPCSRKEVLNGPLGLSICNPAVQIRETKKHTRFYTKFSSFDQDFITCLIHLTDMMKNIIVSIFHVYSPWISFKWVCLLLPKNVEICLVVCNTKTLSTINEYTLGIYMQLPVLNIFYHFRFKQQMFLRGDELNKNLTYVKILFSYYIPIWHQMLTCVNYILNAA